MVIMNYQAGPDGVIMKNSVSIILVQCIACFVYPMVCLEIACLSVPVPEMLDHFAGKADIGFGGGDVFPVEPLGEGEFFPVESDVVVTVHFGKEAH